MAAIIGVLLIIVLLAIAREDWKERQVSLLWFLALLLVAMGYFYWLGGQISFMLTNLFFLLLQAALLLAYWLLRYKNLKLISGIGVGDLVFMLIIASIFSPLNFVVFYFVSLVISLVAYLLVKQFIHTKHNTVPLAGLQSMCLIVLITVCSVANTKGLSSTYTDDVLLEVLNILVA